MTDVDNTAGSRRVGRPPAGARTAAAAKRRWAAAREDGVWESRARVVLRPIAVPSVLGLYGFAGVLAVLGTSAAAAAIANVLDSSRWEIVAGYGFIAAAALACYLASATLLESTSPRVILPLGKLDQAANTPGSQVTAPIEYQRGMPGVRVGQ